MIEGSNPNISECIFYVGARGGVRLPYRVVRFPREALPEVPLTHAGSERSLLADIGSLTPKSDTATGGESASLTVKTHRKRTVSKLSEQLASIDIELQTEVASGQISFKDNQSQCAICSLF